MLKEIETRQSIRKYKDTPVTNEQVEELLKAAMNAPTARNEQSWRFVVVRNRELLDQFPSLSPYMNMMKTAPCAILVLGDTRLVHKVEYLYYDCSAAIENMLIEACHLGLGTCWCAIGPNEDRIDGFRKALNIEEELVPISIVSVGISDEEKPLVDRYDPLKISWLD